MKQITVIIPLHVFDEENLKDAIKSVYSSFNKDITTLMFVGPKEICEQANKLSQIISHPEDIFKTTLVINDETDFSTQINKAVFKCTTQYFTILEFDDGYKEYYNDVMQKYIERHSDVSLVLPLIECYSKEGNFIGFGNEIVWDPTFASTDEETREDKLGVIDYDALQRYMDFNCTGGLFKTEDFISVGGLKPSLKIAAWYEFLLRLTNIGKNVFVVPRICYSHLIGRKDSYGETMQLSLTPEEGKFLIDYARTDYVNLSDSNLKYTPKEETED